MRSSRGRGPEGLAGRFRQGCIDGRCAAEGLGARVAGLVGVDGARLLRMGVGAEQGSSGIDEWFLCD